MLFFENHSIAWRFLKRVMWLSFFSFGGPSSHYILMRKEFVGRLGVVSEKEFEELMSFCQILPGPSSTQLLTLIGYKIGKTRLSVVALLVWILPATVMMTFLGIGLGYLRVGGFYVGSVGDFLISFTLGLLGYNMLVYMKHHIKGLGDVVLVLILGGGVWWFFHNPWVFPVTIVGSVILFYKRGYVSEKKYEPRFRIKKRFFTIFMVVFILGGVLSEQARVMGWEYRKTINFFENTYRFGATVFGGGNVLGAMLYEQFAVRRQTKYINKKDALMGMGFSQVMPGPVFAYAPFIGTLIFEKEGIWMQLLGAFIGMVGVFLGGYLIGIFAFQVWEHLKQFAFIDSVLPGIHLSVCVILLGTFGYVFIDNNFYVVWELSHLIHCLYVGVIMILLYYKKLNIPLMFLVSVLMGYFFG